MNDLGVPQCICSPGFSGKKCENEMCSDFCLNAGTCLRSAKKLTCICLIGYTGRRCETDINCSDPSKCILPTPVSDKNISSCNQLNCLNGGSCVIIRDRAFCRCNDNWAGLTCEDYRGDYNACKAMCLNGGVCISTKALSSPRCECLPEWTGPRCQTRITCQHYCFNGGTCSPNLDEDLKPTCM